MSEVSFMEKLLDGIDVEWKALGEIAQILNGYAFESSKYSTNGIRVIRISDVQKGKMSDKDLKFYPSETSEEIKRYLLQENDLVMSLTGNVGRVAMLSKADIPAALNQRVACIRVHEEKTFTRYLFHFFDQFSFENEAMSNATGGGQKNMSTKWLSAYKIPIPCSENPKKSLEIQAEIVRILDTFTELTAELTAELSMRKKQYNYYRDKLLTFEEGEVEWKTLGEVAIEFGRGKSRHRPRNDPRLYGGDIPFIQTGDIRNASHIITEYTQTYTAFGLAQSKLWPKGTLCITIAANIAETTILGFDSCFPDSVIGFVANPEVTNSTYVEYLLSSLKTKLQSQSTGSAQDNINMGTFESMYLPFPPLVEQNRIVALLDKFETLTNSITEGLPREIELRQKQYEYYRDLLLSFPKLVEPETVNA